MLERQLSRPVDLFTWGGSSAAELYSASAALVVMPLVGLDDRACAFGNVRCDCWARYDPFAVPIVIAVLGTATGASDAKSSSPHPRERSH